MIPEDSHRRDERRQPPDDGGRLLGRDEAWRLLHEDEAERIGAGIHGGHRVPEIRDAADLDADHEQWGGRDAPPISPPARAESLAASTAPGACAARRAAPVPPPAPPASIARATAPAPA